MGRDERNENETPLEEREIFYRLMQTTLDRAMPNVYLQWKLVYDCTLPLNDIAKAGSDLMHNYFSLEQTRGDEGTGALLPVLEGL